jgi:hypothetical protein
MAISFLAGPAIADRPAVVPSGQIKIDVVAVNGSGCRIGTAVVAPAPDNTAFTVTYSDYMAQVGVGARPTEFRKNCQIGVQVHIPQGFTFAIAEADYRGFAHLEQGAVGTERANYYFQGMSQTAISSHSFGGPYNRGWQATDRTAVAALVFQPCGQDRIVNVNTEIIVDAGSSNTHTTNSFMTMDSADGSVQTIYHLSWRSCP